VVVLGGCGAMVFQIISGSVAVVYCVFSRVVDLGGYLCSFSVLWVVLGGCVGWLFMLGFDSCMVWWVLFSLVGGVCLVWGLAGLLQV